LYVKFQKLTRVDVSENWSLPQTWIKMRSWSCFVWTQFRNLNFVICTIASSHFPSMVNNTSPSLVAMEPHKKPNFMNLWFWTINITMNITCWTNDDIYDMIVSTHLLDWSCKRANYGQHLGHLKNKNKICENKKIMKNVERIFL